MNPAEMLQVVPRVVISIDTTVASDSINPASGWGVTVKKPNGKDITICDGGKTTDEFYLAIFALHKALLCIQQPSNIILKISNEKLLSTLASWNARENRKRPLVAEKYLDEWLKVARLLQHHQVIPVYYHKQSSDVSMNLARKVARTMRTVQQQLELWH